MKIKHKRYRDRCVEYLKVHDSATSDEMLNNIVNHLGQMKSAPINAKALSQLLNRDDRFTYDEMIHKTFMNATTTVYVWRLIE